MESVRMLLGSRHTLLELLMEEESKGEEIIGIFLGKSREEEPNEGEDGKMGERLKVQVEGAEG
jgi:hypothetical protein